MLILEIFDRAKSKDRYEGRSSNEIYDEIDRLQKRAKRAYEVMWELFGQAATIDAVYGPHNHYRDDDNWFLLDPDEHQHRGFYVRKDSETGKQILSLLERQRKLNIRQQYLRRVLDERYDRVVDDNKKAATKWNER